MLSYVALSIWRRRNDMLWEMIDVSDFSVVHHGDDLFHGWAKAKLKSSFSNVETGQASIAKWFPPPSRHVKCNIDVIFFHKENITRTGYCVCDHEGTIVGCID